MCVEAVLPTLLHLNSVSHGLDMNNVKDAEKADIEELEVLPTTRVSARSPDEERRLVRKIDLRIMPIACVLYLFACKY